MNTYDSVLVARFLLALAKKKGIPMNVTKVQKLLYILCGLYLANHNHQILNEAPRAWPYGPVFPQTREEVDFGTKDDTESPDFKELTADVELTESLNKILDKYGRLSAVRLSDWSHQKDSPWDRVINVDSRKWNSEIPSDYIRGYFSNFNIV